MRAQFADLCGDDDAVADSVVDDAAIVGDEAHVREQIRIWEAAGVTTMLVSPGSVAEIERLAGLL